MADPTCITISLLAAVANGICESQTPAGAGALTINGSLAVAGPTLFQGNPATGGYGAGTVFSNYAKMDVARRILVADTAASADGSLTFTVNGFNRDLQPISQSVTGVTSATPVATTLDFLVVTSVVASGAASGDVTVGTNTTGSTAWVQCHPYVTAWALSAAGVIVSGSATFVLEHTYDDPNASINPPIGGYGFIPEANSAVPPIALASGTGSASATYEYQYANMPIMAHRLTITAGTGVVNFYSLQSGIRS